MDGTAARIERETMLIGRYMHLAERQSVPELRLERSAYLLLSRLVDEPLTLAELSTAFELDVSTLNRQTSAMLKEGLVERIPDPAGGIARRFRVTPAGARRLDAARTSKVAGIDALLAGWTDAERETLAAALLHLNDTVEARMGSAWPRPDVDRDVPPQD
ncbi:DNA-binding MarR family transcriptional regulator [Sediminihabitans luteus]|uniref:DNA-binding MarR family transcriptional regulator n=1 Tax=Sediminihabitans luteus TaxID=1138585 RepID=A0A2M9CD48_9CELL|nr:MarR family transcriptional regulator [Sediminihabitans luteus]PJJ69256.1 DNA-binding MarR family transcriptional regulator [Sediminihabitans luteus]GII98932.1 transcriptional regulator [Sediminihabitans luteus]